jgi:serine O-acetyltransferase
VVIGDDVDIGANAVVIKDIPSFHIAVGVPAIAKAKKQKNII